MENILQDIIQCEEEAARLESEAKQEALEILTKARKSAEEIIEKSLVDGEAMVEDILQKARSEANDVRKQHQEINLEADEKFRLKSREKLDTAAEFIAGRVVNKSWQW